MATKQCSISAAHTEADIDFTHDVTAAFSISAPLSRIRGREEELAQAVRIATQQLSARLGFAGS